MRPHKVLEHKNGEGVYALKLTEGKHAGIIFSYGKVEFKENEAKDNLVINFEYEIHEDYGITYDKGEFERELGEFLQELIEYGVENNDITYTGGIDEGRKDDSEQSDLR